MYFESGTPFSVGTEELTASPNISRGLNGLPSETFSIACLVVAPVSAVNPPTPA